MGKRGPAPKPTAIRELQGNPSKRPLPKHEPKPSAGDDVLERPYGMPYYGKKMWDALAPKLHRLGLLTEIDVHTLQVLCESWSDYREARKAFDEYGMIAISEKGSPYLHPAYNGMVSARREFVKQAQQFGMTPSARTRIVIDADEEEDSIANQLFKAIQGE